MQISTHGTVFNFLYIKLHGKLEQRRRRCRYASPACKHVALCHEEQRPERHDISYDNAGNQKFMHKTYLGTVIIHIAKGEVAHLFGSFLRLMDSVSIVPAQTAKHLDRWDIHTLGLFFFFECRNIWSLQTVPVFHKDETDDGWRLKNFLCWCWNRTQCSKSLH